MRQHATGSVQNQGGIFAWHEFVTKGFEADNCDLSSWWKGVKGLRGSGVKGFGDYYTRVNPDSMFVVPKPIARLGIGIDALPEFIRTSPLLTGNELAMMGNVEKLPEQAELSALESSPDFMRLKDQSAQLDKWEMAKSLLKTGQPTLALTWLMFGDQQI